MDPEIIKGYLLLTIVAVAAFVIVVRLIVKR